MGTNFPPAFSDGSPTYEAALAAATISALLALWRLPRARAFGLRLERVLARWLWRRGVFVEREADGGVRKLALFRIGVVGAALGIRIVDGADAWASGSDVLWAHGGLIALHALVAAGLLLPLSGLALCVLMSLVFDNATGGSTLIFQVLTMMVWLVTFAPAGPTLSVDGLLIWLGGPIGRAVSRLYDAWGRGTPERIAVSRFAAFLAFASMCVWAGVDHLAQPSWVSGEVVSWLMLSPGMNFNSSWWWVAEAAYRAWPAGFGAWSFVSSWGMIGWELLIVPLVLANRWTRLGALVWGVLFFLSTYFVLQLRGLGWFQLALFAALFWTAPLPRLFASRANAGLERPESSTVGFAGASAVLLAIVALLLRLAVGGPEGRPGDALSMLKAGVGQSFQAAGIGPVRVYGETDLRMGSIVLRISDDEGGWEGAEYGSQLSTPEFYLHYRLRRQLAARDGFCPGADFWQQIAAALRSPGAPPVVLKVGHAIRPPTATLLGTVPASVEVAAVCSARINREIGVADPVQVDTDGVVRLADEVGLALPRNAEAAQFLLRFPCSEELRRLALWTDVAPEISTASAQVLLQESRALRNLGPIACAGRVRALEASLGTDWTRYPARVPNRPCSLELAAGQAILSAMPESAGQRHRATMAMASEFARAGDARNCILAVDAVRRAAWAGTPDPAVALPAVPRRLASVPGVYPCLQERARIGWWSDRFGTPSSRVIAERALQAPNEAEACFALVESAELALGVGWLRQGAQGALPCDPEVSLAAHYHDLVADAPMRALMAPSMATAVRFNASGDQAACQFHSAVVRELFLLHFGLRSQS